MAQRRLDGKEEPPSRQSQIRAFLLECAKEDPHLDYEVLAKKAQKRGIFNLEEIVAAAYKEWASELKREARRLKHKDGTPRVIPIAGEPNQGILLDAARTEDRFLNVLTRGLQTFGHQQKWRSSARDMEERGEETLPVAEFREGWAEILARYRLEAASVPSLQEEELVIDGDEDTE